MPQPEDWILIELKANQQLRYTTKQRHFKTAGFLRIRFKELLVKSLTYAFISGPLVELPVKIAINRKDRDVLKASIINVIKRRFAESLIIEIFTKGGLGVTQNRLLKLCINISFVLIDVGFHS